MYTQIIIKCIILCIIKLLSFFSLQYIRMSGKNINLNSNKIKKSNFYKNKEINNIEDINVNNILVSKSHMVIQTHLNTLLDITIMLLDRYV